MGREQPTKRPPALARWNFVPIHKAAAPSPAALRRPSHRVDAGGDAVKWGWDASVLIPIMGLCYVGTAIMGKWMLGEPVNATRWFGIVLIIVGVIFVARSVTQATVPLFNRGMAHTCVRDSVHKP